MFEHDSCAALKQLAAGGLHSCAWLRAGTDDFVQCWGEGDSGQLGYGMTDDIGTGSGPNASVAVPVQHRVALNLQTGEQVLQIAAGGFHTCALLATQASGGEVRCWGDNSHGQLGVDQDVDNVLVNMGQAVQFPIAGARASPPWPTSAEPHPLPTLRMATSTTR